MDFSVDELFEAFCNCAELNPDPSAGNQCHKLIILYPWTVFMYSYNWHLTESDEEHGWVHGDEGYEDMTDGKHS